MLRRLSSLLLLSVFGLIICYYLAPTSLSQSGPRSLSLNGTSQYMSVPNSSTINITGPLTVEAWIKPNAIGSYQYIVSRETYGQAGTGGGYELTLNNVGKVRLDLYQSHNQYTTAIGNVVLTTGVWYHVAGVFDGSYMRTFINGVEDASVNLGSPPGSGTSSLKIGRNSGGGYFNGLIDEVRVSNIAPAAARRDSGNSTGKRAMTRQAMRITARCKAVLLIPPMCPQSQVIRQLLASATL